VTDEELVARAREGAPEAWTELVHRHHGAVFRTAHAALASRDDAADAAQDAWVAAWHHLAEFRGQSSVRTWLLTIAWRKALDRRRSMLGWLRAMRLDAPRDDETRPAIELVAPGHSAEGASIDREQRRRIHRLVKGLPRAHRDALLLVVAGDLPYAEAAVMLGVPVGTLKWRVSDARRLLRERMTDRQAATGRAGSRRAAPPGTSETKR
jgi:RNA polymerase sigma-70 factor (ECF subfamily)